MFLWVCEIFGLKIVCVTPSTCSPTTSGPHTKGCESLLFINKNISLYSFSREHTCQLCGIALFTEEATCSIFKNILEVNEKFAAWSHLYHLDCILMSMRSINSCPKCRHKVEGADISVWLIGLCLIIQIKQILFYDYRKWGCSIPIMYN